MLIFDFDGTIADSLPVLLSCFNEHATYYGYKKIGDESYADQLRSKDGQEILKELGVSYLKLPFVVRAVRKSMSAKMAMLKPFPAITDVLRELHQQGVSLGIVTSNAQANVEQFLQMHNLDFFEFVHGESSIFGKKKVLKNLLTKNRCDASSTIYIGDETRDIQAAQANAIRCAAVTWGFNTVDRLKQEKPDFLIRRPEELLGLAKSWLE